MILLLEWCERPDLGLSTDVYADGDHPEGAYTDAMYGGVSRVVLDPDLLSRALETGGDGSAAVISSNLVLTGTEFNCSGGWVEDGWVSCEETDREQHGYAFLTRIDDDRVVRAEDRRIHSWGRLKREGVTVRSETGHVFMTEDHKNGCLYRFVPDEREDFMGPGSLQAMAIDGLSDTDPEVPLTEGSSWSVRWIDIPDPQAAERPCREQGVELGATRFNRCEGNPVYNRFSRCLKMHISNRYS